MILLLRNFNTARTVDLREYLPNALQNVLEMRTIAEVETEQIQKLWDACENCMHDQFIADATENGLSRQERLLGILPFADDTPENRRFRILSYYNSDTPYTKKSLATMLDSLVGADGYELHIGTGTFSVMVKLALSARKELLAVWDLLERILPYNMTFSVELLYNTWEKVSACTWADAAGYTWQDVREKGELYAVQ